MTVLQEIRKTSQIPVIMLTALSDTKSELEGFALGACDYVSKPFHAKVLLARVRAALTYKYHLRRVETGEKQENWKWI